MPVEWSGLGPDLMLSVDRALAAPLRSQLEDQLREAIRHGRVRAGERLPSSRALARDLGLSRGLVQDCYAQLLAEGYLTARTGSATVVAPGARTAAAEPRPRRAGPRAGRRLRARAAGSRQLPARRLGARAAGGVPDRADRRVRLRRSARQSAAARGPGRLPASGSGARRPTRSASWICAGFAQGLAVALAVLRDAGLRQVGFEDPGYADTGPVAARQAGLEPVPVPVDADGIDTDALTASGSGRWS